AARGVQVLGPAPALARAQVLGERLGLRARGRQAGALPLDLLAVRLVGAAALLEAGDGAREVAALAGEQPLRRLQRARRAPVAARDRQRQALAHGVVGELEARRAGRGIGGEGGE